MEPTRDLLRSFYSANDSIALEVSIGPPETSTVSPYGTISNCGTLSGSRVLKTGTPDLTALSPPTSERSDVHTKLIYESEGWNTSKVNLHRPSESGRGNEPLSARDPWAVTSIRFPNHPNGRLQNSYIICLAFFFYPLPIFFESWDSSFSSIPGNNFQIQRTGETNIRWSLTSEVTTLRPTK